jgi:glyoxylase-like metal-dependent hydrolase (beta-lactamase superfamily II)
MVALPVKSEKIDESIYKIQVPLPESPLGFLNSYFIRDGGSGLLIDTGFDHPVCGAALIQGLDELGSSLDGAEVFITHSHPDHMGGLAQIFHKDMRVYGAMPPPKALNQENRESWRFFSSLAKEVNESLGIDSHEDVFKGFDLPVTEIQKLAEGDVVRVGMRTFSVLHTPGHDRWHLCLYEEKSRMLISGDHILGHISPIIVTHSLDYDALGFYLDNLSRLRELPIDKALPAYGPIIVDVKSRIDCIIDHHQMRLREVYKAIKNGATGVTDIAAQVSWNHKKGYWKKLSLINKYLAAAETLAHLVHLKQEGMIGLDKKEDRPSFICK